MASFTLAKAIPDQVINEGAAYKPLDLKQFIQAQDARSQIRFQAELEDGRPLPQGMICTAEGVFTGIPARGTEGAYVVVLKAQDVIEGDEFATRFNLLIKPVNVATQHDLLKDLKAQIWEAVGKGQPLPVMPDLGGIFNWPVTPFDIYYLLERFAYLTIWDAYNMDAPGKAVPINLKGASEHYRIVDRGSCIVASPKDLFSDQRTPRDALITARAMAEEVYKRGWTIEFSGFDKMVRAAWVRLQVLGKQQGKYLEILHYAAPAEDTVIYTKEIGALSDQKPAP
jgi:hypothetical protein